LAGGGTLKFCVGATGKNYSPWDNILSIVVYQYFLGQQWLLTVGPSIHLFPWYFNGFILAHLHWCDDDTMLKLL